MGTRFNHLQVPDQYNQYFSKYPQGYTILEALLNWVQQVNDMTDNLTSWNTYLDEFVLTFDTDLQDKVTDTLSVWQSSGFLKIIIDQALQTQIDNTNAQLANKADKTEVFTMANMGQDVRETMTGGSVAVVGVDAVLEANIVNKAVTPKKLSIVNVLNGRNTWQDNMIDQYGQNINTTNGTIYTQEGVAVSKLIKFEVGTYTLYSFRRIAKYTSAGVFIEFVVDNGASQVSNTFTFSEVTYMRMSVYYGAPFSNYLQKAYIAKEQSFSGYEAFYEVYRKTDDIKDTNWLRKKHTSYGDSNTASNVWQPLVANKLGLLHTAQGVSGSTIVDYSTWAVPMCADSRLNAIPSDSDIITIMGGTNDWLGHKPLGTIASTNKQEFYGAYKYIIDSILTRVPKARIILICPMFTYYKITGTGIKNNINLTIADYGKAVKALGELYNLPVIDALSLMGVNEKNYTHFFNDEAESILHPNTTGHSRLAGIVHDTFRQLESL